MATATKIPLASVTLSAATASITFSGISQSYTDLLLVAMWRKSGNGSQDKIDCRVNGDSGTNYSDTYLYGGGSSAASGRETGKTMFMAGYAASSDASSGAFGMTTMNFQSYSNTTTYKTIINNSFTSAPSGVVIPCVGLWRSTAAITSITLYPDDNSNWISGCTFNLYGIL